MKRKILPNVPVGSLGWSAGECEPAAPPGSPSVGPAPPKHPVLSDAESGAAAAPHSPSPPHSVSPVLCVYSRILIEMQAYMCSFRLRAKIIQEKLQKTRWG